MKTMTKRIVAVLLILALTVGVSATAFAADSDRSYRDVKQTAWYYDAVDYVTALGVMNGVAEGTFSPNGNVSRAMFLTMLYRLAGSPAVTVGEMAFTDVAPDAYYAKAVAWGTRNSIINGVSRVSFAPHKEITREQIACMVIRYSEAIHAAYLSEENHVEQAFADQNDVSPYAKREMALMVYRGLYNGTGDGIFKPRKTATRAEAAAVFMRLALLLEKVPSVGTLTVGEKSTSLNTKDTVSLYTILHSGMWEPTEYAEYVPYYTLNLWGTEYRFAENPSDYNGFNIVIGETYSGMHGKDSAAEEKLALIYEVLARYGDLIAYTIAKPAYPEMVPYPFLGSVRYDSEAYYAWLHSVSAQWRDLGDTSLLQSFFARSSQTFLRGAAGQNRVYSPLNVYMALSMLAQITDGESREQLLNLLGSDSIEALRKQASDVWNSNYQNDGALTSILASSLWLNQDVKFKQDTVDILARDFYASSYQGEMGSKGFNQALQNWLNEQTGGLLKKQAENIELDRSTVLALATTVYFKAKWDAKFSKEITAPQTFHTPTGDVQTDFMYQRSDQSYFWGDRFAAVEQPFELGGSMWFLLPDEGVSPEELLADSEVVDFLFTGTKSGREKSKDLLVNKFIPKFDVSSQFDLKEGLQALGVTDVFDPAQADFTPITDMDGIYTSRSDHAARVVIDEDGCTAAAFTVMSMPGATTPPDEEVDFVLDRPFLFCVTGINGLPLFVGIVNYPTGK